MPIRATFKRIVALAGALAALIVPSGCTGENSSVNPNGKRTETTGNVTLTAFNVGKADALVLQTEHSVTVIDTGNKGDGKEIERFLTNQGIDTIDTLIITHFDKDHVGGAARLVNRMKIGRIYTPDYVSDAEDYINFTEKVYEVGAVLMRMPVRDVKTWKDDDADFTLYAPNETFYGNNEENDFSLCLYVRHGDNTFLFTGDAEDKRQNEILNLGLGKVTFLKFPYHGNYLPVTEKFLDECNPDVTIVCCSKKDYADDHTVETLNKRKIESYYTCDGRVTVVSDGETLTCTQETKE